MRTQILHTTVSNAAGRDISLKELRDHGAAHKAAEAAKKVWYDRDGTWLILGLLALFCVGVILATHKHSAATRGVPGNAHNPFGVFDAVKD